MLAAKERVQAGAGLLDKVLPGWWDGKGILTIDLTILDIESPSKCVLGQCFGNYDIGCARLGLPAWTVDFKEGELNASDVGFLPFDEDENLTNYWCREIRRRRREEKKAKS